jgi:hypothetical protein
MPEQFAASPGTAYGIPFITMSNVAWVPTNNSFTVTFDTDAPCLMAMDWWSHNDPSITVPGSVLEGVSRTHHTISTGAMPAPVGSHAGKVFGFSLRLDTNDTSGMTLRSQQGFVQLIGARAYAGKTLPVRWNTFGDGSAPAGGGGIGNWSTYKWAQYNPSGAAYPAP